MHQKYLSLTSDELKAMMLYNIIKLQIKTAPDSGGSPGTWTPTWSGPEGNDGDETDFFTISKGEITQKLLYLKTIINKY